VLVVVEVLVEEVPEVAEVPEVPEVAAVVNTEEEVREGAVMVQTMVVFLNLMITVMLVMVGSTMVMVVVVDLITMAMAVMVAVAMVVVVVMVVVAMAVVDMVEAMIWGITGLRPLAMDQTGVDVGVELVAAAVVVDIILTEEFLNTDSCNIFCYWTCS